MNYGGGGSSNNPDSANGWENILCSYFGNGVGAPSGTSTSGSSGSSSSGGGLNGGGTSSPYDATAAYAAFFGQPAASGLGSAHPYYSAAAAALGGMGGFDGMGGVMGLSGLGGFGGGYSLTMPSASYGDSSRGHSYLGHGDYGHGQYSVGGGRDDYGSGSGGGVSSSRRNTQTPSPALHNANGYSSQYDPNPLGSHESHSSQRQSSTRRSSAGSGVGDEGSVSGAAAASTSESASALDGGASKNTASAPSYGDYSNYYNYSNGLNVHAGGSGGLSSYSGGGWRQNAAAQDNAPSDLDYCDALLRGMDSVDTSILGGWLAGVSGGAGSSSSNRNHNSYSSRLSSSDAKKKAAALEALLLPQTQSSSHHKTKPSQQRSSHAPTTTSSSNKVASSKIRQPHKHLSSSAQPENASKHNATQIDPLLEKLTLKVSSVSIEPMTGSEVVRHIRSKTDDVITRFLPCVDFLVNCQQELRQGLQIAQRRRISHGRSRNNMNMTPRQFFDSYVSPLPKRFESTNVIIMARDQLKDARAELEKLVRDAHDAVPQGCEHVKNAFLGGMRENESWGLRKWLSRHGGAGSICNDLEEVMRTIKQLKKEEETTKRLAEILRPIASQAHDRLKKDVPQAYQEQSSAHPFLPFFHRLEACLKAMATYDPEEDDVILLDDSDDDDDDCNVVEAVKSVAKVKSSPVKKREYGGGENSTINGSTPASTSTSERKRTSSKREEDEAATQWASAKQEPQQEEGYEHESYKRIKTEHIAKSYEDEEDDDDSSIEILDVKMPGDDTGLPEQAAPTEPEDRVIGQVRNSPLGEETSLPSATQSPLQETEDGDDDDRLLTSSKSTDGAKKGWRCPSCTFLNQASATKCVMCTEDDASSSGEKELADFLQGDNGLWDGSNNSFTQISTLREDQSWRALQAADARELECLADHISTGGSLPRQAHRNVDEFWGATDKFPLLLKLFRSIVQHPTSHHFLEPVNENQLYVAGLPSFKSVVRHPLCFHAIISALSKSEDALKCPLTMRLSSGELETEGLRHWNMWNGLHLVEAIDLVLLNSLAYNGKDDSQHRTDTESLRELLWDGVNSILKSLQPHQRRDHLPQKRLQTSSFVMRKDRS